MKEQWKPVVGFEGYYEVSSLGRIKFLNYKRAGKPHITYGSYRGNGYMQVTLSKDGKRYTKSVHRLVAKAFIPNPYNLPCVNHINEEKDDNRVENLEWCTYEYNVNYGTAIERRIETWNSLSEEEKQSINRKRVKTRLENIRLYGWNRKDKGIPRPHLSIKQTKLKEAKEQANEERWNNVKSTIEGLNKIMKD